MTERDEHAPKKWRSPAPGTIAWISWDDDYVAYHRPSGTTHCLNSSSAVLIEDILQTPADAAAVAKHFNTEQGGADAEKHLQEIRSLLDRFEELGLIEPVE